MKYIIIIIVRSIKFTIYEETLEYTSEQRHDDARLDVQAVVVLTPRVQPRDVVEYVTFDVRSLAHTLKYIYTHE